LGGRTKTVSASLLVLSLFGVAVLSGCISSDGGVQKAKSSGSPTASSASLAGPKANNTTAPPASSSPTPTTTPPKNGTGNGTGSGGSAPPGLVVQAYSFTGSFKGGDEGAAKQVVKTIDVPAYTKLLTVWATWDDGVTGNTPAVVDIDLFVRSTKLEVSAETTDFEYVHFNKTANFTASAGQWKVEVFPFDVPTDTAWTVKVLVYAQAPTVKTFTGTAQGGVNPGSPVPGTGLPPPHKVPIPTGTQVVSARLTWKDTAGANTASCSATNRRDADFDLSVFKGTTQKFTSGNGIACEFGFVYETGKTQGDGTEWEFRVAPFLVPSHAYTLTVEYA
jgi:hypothetical protein